MVTAVLFTKLETGYPSKEWINRSGVLWTEDL